MISSRLTTNARRALGRLWRRSLRVVLPQLRGRRVAGPWTPRPYNEWTLLSEPAPEESTASSELIELMLAAATGAGEVSLDAVAARAQRPLEADEVRQWPGQHYRFLTALAEVWGARNVVEIGTHRGASALALLESAQVSDLTTFDVIAWESIPHSLLRDDDFGPRLSQEIVDLGSAAAFAPYAALFEEADLVFVDGPKDGRFEYVFLPLLLSTTPGRRQLVVVDDVRVLPMVDLWRSVPLPKIDAASVGHFSGTGMTLRDAPIQGWEPTFRLEQGYAW